MREEGDPHARTWMAFGAGRRIWGSRLLPQVRRDLVLIATTIARYEPVSMLVRPEEMDLARGLIGAANIELIAAPVDDLWMRDTGPVFVKTDSGWGGVDFNFNGWGGKQEHHRDANVAEFVAARAGVQTLRTDLVLEGGGDEDEGSEAKGRGGHDVSPVEEGWGVNQGRPSSRYTARLPPSPRPSPK